MSALLDDTPTRSGTHPCGCEWHTVWAPGTANLHEYTRRCPAHAKPRKAKVRAARRGGYGFRALNESERRTQKLAYERAMGRTWEEIDPAPMPADFDGPEYPDYPMMDEFGQVYRGRFHGSRREVARAKAAHDEAMIAYRARFEAYVLELDAWKLTDSYPPYLAAQDRWHRRREQFEYTGRGKDSGRVIERAACVA